MNLKFPKAHMSVRVPVAILDDKDEFCLKYLSVKIECPSGSLAPVNVSNAAILAQFQTQFGEDHNSQGHNTIRVLPNNEVCMHKFKTKLTGLDIETRSTQEPATHVLMLKSAANNKLAFVAVPSTVDAVYPGRALSVTHYVSVYQALQRHRLNTIVLLKAQKRLESGNSQDSEIRISGMHVPGHAPPCALEQSQIMEIAPCASLPLTGPGPDFEKFAANLRHYSDAFIGGTLFRQTTELEPGVLVACRALLRPELWVRGLNMTFASGCMVVKAASSVEFLQTFTETLVRIANDFVLASKVVINVRGGEQFLACHGTITWSTITITGQPPRFEITIDKKDPQQKTGHPDAAKAVVQSFPFLERAFWVLALAVARVAHKLADTDLLVVTPEKPTTIDTHDLELKHVEEEEEEEGEKGEEEEEKEGAEEREATVRVQPPTGFVSAEAGAGSSPVGAPHSDSRDVWNHFYSFAHIKSIQDHDLVLPGAGLLQSVALLSGLPKPAIPELKDWTWVIVALHIDEHGVSLSFLKDSSTAIKTIKAAEKVRVDPKVELGLSKAITFAALAILTNDRGLCGPFTAVGWRPSIYSTSTVRARNAWKVEPSGGTNYNFVGVEQTTEKQIFGHKILFSHQGSTFTTTTTREPIGEQTFSSNHSTIKIYSFGPASGDEIDFSMRIFGADNWLCAPPQLIFSSSTNLDLQPKMTGPSTTKSFNRLNLEVYTVEGDETATASL